MTLTQTTLYYVMPAVLLCSPLLFCSVLVFFSSALIFRSVIIQEPIGLETRAVSTESFVSSPHRIFFIEYHTLSSKFATVPFQLG